MTLSPSIVGAVVRPLFGYLTPAQETTDLLWFVFLLALAVGIVYVFLLWWTLSRHVSHEPLAHSRSAPPRRLPPSGGH
jgi:Ca2+/H+ antiporter